MSSEELDWDQVTEQGDLQDLLYGLMTVSTEEEKEVVKRIQQWLAEHVAPCQAVVVTGQMYLSNGDPGYPDEYCDSISAPGNDGYCEDHVHE